MPASPLQVFHYGSGQSKTANTAATVSAQVDRQPGDIILVVANVLLSTTSASFRAPSQFGLTFNAFRTDNPTVTTGICRAYYAISPDFRAAGDTLTGPDSSTNETANAFVSVLIRGANVEDGDPRAWLDAGSWCYNTYPTTNFGRAYVSTGTLATINFPSNTSERMTPVGPHRALGDPSLNLETAAHKQQGFPSGAVFVGFFGRNGANAAPTIPALTDYLSNNNGTTGGGGTSNISIVSLWNKPGITYQPGSPPVQVSWAITSASGCWKWGIWIIPQASSQMPQALVATMTTAALVPTGTGASTLADATGSGSGSTVTGTGASTLGTLTGAGSGSTVRGTGASTLGTLTGTGSGAHGVAGTGASTFAALTGSGSGSTVRGTGASTFAALTGSGSGSTVTGTGASTLGTLTGTGTGSASSTITGTGASTLADATGNGRGAAVPPGYVVYDTFNRDDNSSTLGVADSGQSWIAGAGTWGIDTNQARLVTEIGDHQNFAVIDSGLGDCVISVDVASGFDGPFCFRYVDANNHWVTAVVGGTYQLYRRDSGSYAGPIVAGGTAGSGTITLELLGSSITLKRNGVTQLTWSDSTYATATKHGLRVYSDTSQRWDNFTVVTGGVGGSGASTLGMLTGSGSGAHGVAGTGASTLAAATSTGSGSTVTGTGASTLAALTGSGAGSTVRGTGASTFAALTGAGTGAHGVAGSGASTFGTLTGAGSGAFTPSGVSGTGASTLGTLTGAGVGSTVTGSGSSTLGALTGTGSGSTVRGTGSSTLGTLTGAGSGVRGNAGTGASILGVLVGVGAGSQVAGTGSGALGVLVGAGIGARGNAGAGTSTFAAMAGDGSGTVTGSGALTTVPIMRPHWHL